ncbi:MAG: FAD:protein FMN transferase [Prevotella sp.]|nr:FAD:protein FMN transferase [Prevotella sp.]
MKKKNLLQLAFLAFLVIGTVLIIRQQRAMPYQHDTGMVFGTVYSATYQCDKNLKDQIEAELKKIDAEFSMFNDSSTVARINRGENPALSDMFVEVYQLANSISEATEGAFDITVAPLVNAWGFGFKHEQMPTKQTIDSLRQIIGYQKLQLEKRGGKQFLKKQQPGMMLDFSAIAKGFGVDAVARLLRSRDVKNYMVEIGGEVVTSGINQQRLPWRIGVTKPTDDTLSQGEIQTVLNVTDHAMATSGNYRNFYYRGGKKYAHTIDPKTGYPVQHSILSATVLADRCATADAFATSFMVMGFEGAQKVLQKHPELMVYLIYTDEKGKNAVWYSPALKKKIIDN